MNEKDKQIIKDSALSVADAIVAIVPGLIVPWALSKALYGAGMKLRQQRALEWVEMVRDNPEVFTEYLLQSEDFQDGFVLYLEKYLVERIETKRLYLRNIFLNFARSEHKDNFDLEKYSDCLSRLTDSDIRTLPYVNTHTSVSYQVFDDARSIENIYNLVNVGIIYLDLTSRWGPMNSPYVYTSSFGRRFIEYLKH